MKSIERNHSLLVDPRAKVGRIYGTPVREDYGESYKVLGSTFLLNVILKREMEVVKAVAGDALQAHRIGVQVVILSIGLRCPH